MSELQVYTSKVFGNVRTILIDGEPWFVGKDVASILGYKDTTDAIKKHVDDDDKGVGNLPTPGGLQKVTIINESGVYSLIFSSQLDSAKAFKHWVTHEVLPSIRKQGYYSTLPSEQLIGAIVSAANSKDRYPLVIEAIRAAKVDHADFISDLTGIRQADIPKKLTVVSNENRHGRVLTSDWKKYHYGDFTAKDLYGRGGLEDYIIDAAIEKCARQKSDFSFYNFIRYCGEIHFTKDGYLAILDYIDKMGYMRSKPGLMKEWRDEVKNAV